MKYLGKYEDIKDSLIDGKFYALYYAPYYFSIFHRIIENDPNGSEYFEDICWVYVWRSSEIAIEMECQEIFAECDEVWELNENEIDNHVIMETI